MSLILDGTNGLSDVDGTAATPAIRGTDTNTGIFFPAADTIAFSEGGAEAARFDSSGNLGIGTTNPGIYSTSARVLSVNTSAGNNTVAMALVNAAGDTNTSVSLDFVPNTNITLAQIQGFRTNAFGGATDFRFLSYNGSSLAERMRIDSSGNLLVGTTNARAPLTVEKAPSNSAYGQIAAFSNASGDVGNAGISVTKFDNNTTTSQVFARFLVNQGSTASGQINANGASAAAFGAYSDARLKENIVNLPSQLANIMALRPVEFDYKAGGHQIGFIAQEVNEIYPDLVGEDENGMLTLTDMNKNDARLIKAIQELKAIVDQQSTELDSVKAELATLKGAA